MDEIGLNTTIFFQVLTYETKIGRFFVKIGIQYDSFGRLIVLICIFLFLFISFFAIFLGSWLCFSYSIVNLSPFKY